MTELVEFSGELVKIAFADQADLFLNKNSPDRPAARFNRRGENALYLSVDEASARVAMQKYFTAQDPPRVLIRYHISSCHLVNLRHANNASLRKQSSHDWLAEHRAGVEPSSWRVADALRRKGEVGLIDPSRKNPELWHVTLLRWNEPGAPKVTMIEQPVPFFIVR